MNPIVLFDMDGTLLDSIPPMAKCCNLALARHSLPQHPVQEYNRMVGWGMERLIRLACPQESSEELIAAVMKTYNEIYQEECRLPGIIYPGLADMLRLLRSHGIHTAIISNKPENQASALFHSTFEEVLDTVWGHREGYPHKPDPTLALELVRSLEGRLLCYVGDSGVDMELGYKLGVPTIGVTWGTKSREELESSGYATALVDTADELEEVLLSYCEL